MDACFNSFSLIWTKQLFKQNNYIYEEIYEIQIQIGMRYPNIIYFRYDKYKHNDPFFTLNKDALWCNVNIHSALSQGTNNPCLNLLFDPNYHLLVTVGDNEKEYFQDVYAVLPPRFNTRWLHFQFITNVDFFNGMVNHCYAKMINMPAEMHRPAMSIFTTCYKSYEKILRAYESIKKQGYLDWEWVVMDDSPEEEHFVFLRTLFQDDKRVRLYKRSENSGNIGNVKNEVVGLCRGKYVLEMDHDDEILPDLIQDAVAIFENDPDVGFVYSDFINLYEDGRNFRYSDFFGLGYECYYCKKYQGKWVYVCSTANVNNITLSHIVGVPNHVRIWKKTVLDRLGNYCEFLPIADDYQLLLRTAVFTKMAKLHKMGYIQYMNANNNNFSLIRNSEINRLVPHHLFPHGYADFNIPQRMKELGAFEDELYMTQHSQFWKRGNQYVHKYCNKIVNPDYDKVFCVIGIENLIKHLPRIKELMKHPRHDFLLLENKMKCEQLWKFLDEQRLDHVFKCYGFIDLTYEELGTFFQLIYKSVDDHEIIKQ